jgi:hypothetical protein
MFLVGVGKCEGRVERQQEAAPFSRAENDRQERSSSTVQLSAGPRGRTELFIRLEIALRVRICC